MASNPASRSSMKSPALQDLLKIQSQRTALEQEAERHRRRLADHSSQSPEIQRSWFKSMKTVMQEIDDELHCIPEPIEGQTFQFLDLGCCPGGFSSYILSKNSKATGVGISLDVQKGGHEFYLEEDLRSRFELKWADLTNYALGSDPYATLHDHRLQPFPFPPGSTGFDLVILDGHPLRGDAHEDSADLQDHYANGDRIFISQLILGLWTIGEGGTMIVKLTAAQSDKTAQLLYMFDTLAQDLQTWKPIYMHATQSTFYAVASGMGLGVGGARHAVILGNLQQLWEELRYDNNGAGRRLRDDDFEFIVPRRNLKGKGFRARRNELTEHILRVQAQSRKEWREFEGYGRSDSGSSE